MFSLYLNYGISIGVLGLVGFLLTHAKSALISGLASAVVLIIIAFLIEKPFVSIIAKVINIMLLGVFSWRASLAITAFMNEHPDKLVPGILLAVMALVSLVVLFLSFRK
jgi:uncharacterized membrane protein (UPF0136 family)